MPKKTTKKTETKDEVTQTKEAPEQPRSESVVITPEQASMNPLGSAESRVVPPYNR